MIIERVLNREGKEVPFDRRKIYNAICKAFISHGYYDKHNLIEEITDAVVKELNDLNEDGNSVINIESIGNLVEKILLGYNLPDVSKAYILYSQKHKELRQENILKDIKKNNLSFIDDKGNKVLLSKEIIKSKIESYVDNYKYIDTSIIVKEVLKNLYEGIHIKEIDKLILNTVINYTVNHYEYSYLASKVLLDTIYKSVLDISIVSSTYVSKYKKKFTDYIEKGVNNDFLNPELKKFDLKKIVQALDPKRDLLFMYYGTKIISDRYLLKDSKDVIFELPQWMWMRVAMGLALQEKDRTNKAIDFYNVLSNFDLVSSTPTLFNSGTNYMQLSSCFLNKMEDSLGSIFDTYKEIALLSKWAGGIGTDWTSVRASGGYINKTKGRSQGIIPFIKIFNDIALAVNQGGKRKGALATYLENWHLDINEYLELRKNTGDDRRRGHDIHTSLFISDLFMKRVKNNGKWTLFDPLDVPDLHELYGSKFEAKYIEYEKDDSIRKKVVDATELWRKSLTMLYETGHPWISFKDTINVRNPQSHDGVIHSSNLCTEITLNTSKDETAVCNLASLNLNNMFDSENVLDVKKLKRTINIGMRMLDNVIDINYYTSEKALRANKKSRPVGLGLMGYHDVLFRKKYKFDSLDNVHFADELMEMISYEAISSSSDLAKEKGKYKTYKGSKWDLGIFPIDTLDILEKERNQDIKVNRGSRLDWKSLKEKVKKYGMRNSNCMAIAPTATISNIIGVVPCVEPIFKNIYMKEGLSGNFIIVNRYLVDTLQEINLWNDDIIKEIKFNNGSIQNIDKIPDIIKDVFKEVFEIDMKWLIECAAVRSKWIDQSASTNLFFNTVEGKLLSESYFKIWEMGIKTTYYLRSLAASQITKTVVRNTNEDKKQSCNINDDDCEVCQ